MKRIVTNQEQINDYSGCAETELQNAADLAMAGDFEGAAHAFAVATWCFEQSEVSK